MDLKMMNKFSFAQMTSNQDGKTSGSGTLGVFAGFAGILAFLYGCIDYSFMSKDGTIMTQSIIVLTIGAGLLGYRKFKGDATPVAAEEPPVDEPIVDQPLNEGEQPK